MNISTKELETIGAGVIRTAPVKKSIKGEICEAKIYRNNHAIKVLMLYTKKGNNILLDIQDDNKNESRREFNKILQDVSKLKAQKRELRRNDKTLKFVNIGLMISSIVTGLNIMAATQPKDITYVAADLILTTPLLFIRHIERRKYE